MGLVYDRDNLLFDVFNPDQKLDIFSFFEFKSLMYFIILTLRTRFNQFYLHRKLSEFTLLTDENDLQESEAESIYKSLADTRCGSFSYDLSNINFNNGVSDSVY